MSEREVLIAKLKAKVHDGFDAVKDCVRLSVTEDTKDLVDLTIG